VEAARLLCPRMPKPQGYFSEAEDRPLRQCLLAPKEASYHAASMTTAKASH
jgi:hypothetical protein